MAHACNYQNVSPEEILRAATTATLARRQTTSAAERFKIKEQYFCRVGYSKPAIAMWERIVDGSFTPEIKRNRTANQEKRGRHGKAILVVHPDGSAVIYGSQQAAAMALHVSPALITLYLRSKVQKPMFDVRPA